MTKRNIFHRALLLIAIALSSFMAISYGLARRAAANIFAPVPKDLVQYYGTVFLPLGFEGESDGPCWYVRYDPDALVIAPYGVYVDMFGNVTGTYPDNLLDGIKIKASNNASQPTK